MKSYKRGSFPAIEEGKTYSVEYPFCRDKIHLFDEEGGAEVETWRPGTRQMHENNGEFAELWTEADAMGEMLLSVVSVHRPGVYPERVFFTRGWKDPDGKVFGKDSLRIKSKAAFKRMLKGYRHKPKAPYAGAMIRGWYGDRDGSKRFTRRRVAAAHPLPRKI